MVYHFNICSDKVCYFLYQGRGITWTPRNKKPDKLRDNLREYEVASNIETLGLLLNKETGSYAFECRISILSMVQSSL